MLDKSDKIFLTAVGVMFFIVIIIGMVCDYKEGVKTQYTPGIVNDSVPAVKIKEFKYKGHEYIEFVTHEGRYSNGTIVHSPDCPCLDDVKDLVDKMQMDYYN